MKVLLDTGCSRTMVRRNVVPAHKLIEGKEAAICCAHGDTTFYSWQISMSRYQARI